MTIKSVEYEIAELRNILSYSKNVGFFFGAGTSCAFGLPDVGRLTNDVKGMLDSELKIAFESIENYLKEVLPNETINIEHILNHVRLIREITLKSVDKKFNDINGVLAESLDKKICANIYEIIQKVEHQTELGQLRRFFAWLETLNNDFMKEIFTTNYDLLFEKAMEYNQIPYFDGFVGSFEPFFLHESIDKKVEINDITYNWIRLWKIHGSLNWEVKNPGKKKDSRIIRNNGMIKPQNELVIYPSREKYSLSRRQPYLTYLDRLRNYLSNGELLFIISGYSFNDQHLNETILNCLRNNTRLFVLVFCYTDKQVIEMSDYANSFLNICVFGEKKIIKNGGIFDLQLTEISEKSNGNLDVYWNADTKKLKLGNFSNLIDFFVDISGRKERIESQINGE